MLQALLSRNSQEPQEKNWLKLWNLAAWQSPSFDLWLESQFTPQAHLPVKMPRTPVWAELGKGPAGTTRPAFQ